MKSAKNKKKKQSDIVMGSTVLGERGQVVIPKAIRDTMKLKSGTRLLVMMHDHGIGIIPAEKMHNMIQEMSEELNRFSKN